MAGKNNFMKKILVFKRIKYGIYKRDYCGREDNIKYRDIKSKGEPLPNDVVEDTEWPSRYFILTKPDLTPSELMEYLAYIQIDKLESIRKSMLFFVIVTCIGLVGAIVWAVANF